MEKKNSRENSLEIAMKGLSSKRKLELLEELKHK